MLCKIYFLLKKCTSDPPLFFYISFFTLVQRYIYIYRKYFLRNIQRDIFNLPLDILNIPIISLANYKEKISNYTKYLKKKSNGVSAKYLKITFRKWDMELQKFHKRKRRCEIFASKKSDAKFSHFLAWCSRLQMTITSSFQLQFAHRLKRWTLDFSSLKKIYSMYTMDSRKCSKFFLKLLFFWISYSMWRFRNAMRNCFMLDFSLYFSSLLLLIGLETYCQGLQKILPHSWLASMIKKLPKTPKLAKNWLVTLARVLNVPIELKGNKYYSKVFKRVYNKL